ncbi:uncharacterized protein LOC117110829 [Anneissia japonica]|uniref:uncharacterized protein LOC117110829 n=1 Tax=Anneissia japonica TaxID=1529436 RepID=UPI00142597E8|nr:uncharacterized protein LOC117110829 [Anneissia japonica]
MDIHSAVRRFWIPVCLILFGLSCVAVNTQTAFLKEPQTEIVDQGTNHVLECSVNKTYVIGLLSVYWLRQDVVIAERTLIEKEALKEFVGDDEDQLNRYTIAKTEQGNIANYELHIDRTQGVDSGDYKCVICEHSSLSFDCLKITEHQSQVATFTVRYTPSVPEYPQCTGLDTQVSVNTDVEVTCTSQIGEPKVELKWKNNGVEVSSVTEREDLEKKMIYLMYSFTATLASSGIVLSCSSSSSYFPSYSGSCSFNPLVVVDMPVVTVTSGATEYEEGTQANFTCAASSATQITNFDWTVGNIPSSRYTQVDLETKSILTIASVQLSDHRSVIKCVVTNSQGQNGQDQVIMDVVGGPTGIIPTSRNDPSTTKALTTKEIIVITTSEPGGSGGNIGAAVGGAVAGFVIVLLLILIVLYCYKQRNTKNRKEKEIVSIGAPQNGLSNHVPTKKIEYEDDDVKKEPLPASEPDVVPRQHNGNHDPRSWWRESMPGDSYRKDDNEYPTIKRMQMPFTQRQPSLENLQERVEMDNYRSGSNDYDDRQSESYREAPTDGRYDYNPSPSVHGSDMGSHPPMNQYNDYHNPQFDHPDSYHRPPSVDHYSDYNYPQEDPRLHHSRSPVNYGPPPQERYDNYRDYGSYDRRTPGNGYGHRPGIDNPSYRGEMYQDNDIYERNPNYPVNYDPGYSEDGSVFSGSTDRYYDHDPRMEEARSPPFYPDNNGYASSDRPISPYADIPPGQTNNSSDVLYMQGHDVDTSDPSYV